MLAGLLLIYWLALFLTNSTSGFYNNLFEVFFGAVPFFAGIVALLGLSKWRTQKIIYKGLLFTALGILFWGIGGFIWSFSILLYDNPWNLLQR